MTRCTTSPLPIFDLQGPTSSSPKPRPSLSSSGRHPAFALNRQALKLVLHFVARDRLQNRQGVALVDAAVAKATSPVSPGRST